MVITLNIQTREMAIDRLPAIGEVEDVFVQSETAETIPASGIHLILRIAHEEIADATLSNLSGLLDLSSTDVAAAWERLGNPSNVRGLLYLVDVSSESPTTWGVQPVTIVGKPWSS